MNNKEQPLVSVACITYNHEEYIRQAIEGFLNQEVNFPIEIFIHDDASTDKTPAIISEYVAKHPDLIVPLLQQENQYSKGKKPFVNFVLPRCRGKYVAICEGDDYWTDPLKLQKQVDYLESHRDCVICFHTASISENNHLTPKSPLTPYFTTVSTLEDLILQSYIQTCTVMFRNRLISKFPDWVFKTVMGDWALHILNAQYGKIGYIDETMAVYRAHPGGIWSSRSNLDKCLIMVDFYFLLKQYFGTLYSHVIKQGLSREYIYLSSIYADQGNIADAKVYLNKSIRSYFSFRGKWVDQIVLLGRLYFPRIYRFTKWIQRKGRSLLMSHRIE